MKHIYIAGACGSIGTQSLDIIRAYPDEFKIIGMSVGKDLNKAIKIIEEFKPQIVCFRYPNDIKLSYNPRIVYGDEGLRFLASYSNYENEYFLNALVGISGLIPTVEAIKARKNILLANKETLVVAGDIINSMIKKYGVKLLPIDSEHSAILQCLRGERPSYINKLIITASGGSFRDKTRDELKNVTKEMALAHPNWKMGPKITIDSATMMNKGFEVIEAHYLFDIDYENITTILHKESIVHSLVEFKDGSIKAQLGNADMHIPIAYALRYPSHETITGESLKLLGTLHFEELSTNRYPCLYYAYLAAKKGGVYLAVLNASNEAAVKLFLDGKIQFLEIEDIIYREITDPKYAKIEYNLDNVIKLSGEIILKILRMYGAE